MNKDINSLQLRSVYTPIMLKKLNRMRVYDYLYTHERCPKLEISQALSLSIPTVGTIMKELEAEGLITVLGPAESTGGRKAQVFSCNYQARTAIGVELIDIGIRLLATDLKGSKLAEGSASLPFENSDAYYSRLGSEIDSFISGLDIRRENILGVCITIQGFIAQDGERISYSGILKATGVERSTFQRYIAYPCTLIHDTDAAALAETWQKTELSDVFFIALNRHIGGKLILAGERNVKNGMIEHMTLDEHGPLCYCGRHGCVDTFCSARVLQEKSGLSIKEFFQKLHAGDAFCSRIWNEYIEHLALAISNIRMIVDCEIILGGLVVQYMDSSDFTLLEDKVNALCTIREYGEAKFIISSLGEYANQLGACIYLIDRFKAEI